MAENTVKCIKCGKVVPQGEAVSVKGSEVPELAEEKGLKSNEDFSICGICFKELPKEETPDFGSMWDS